MRMLQQPRTVFTAHLGLDRIKIGPTSTLAGIAIVNAMSVEVIGKLHEMGVEPPVMMSSNMAGGDDYGAKWEKAYLDQETARSLVNKRCPKR